MKLKIFVAVGLMAAFASSRHIVHQVNPLNKSSQAQIVEAPEDTTIPVKPQTPKKVEETKKNEPANYQTPKTITNAVSEKPKNTEGADKKDQQPPKGLSTPAKNPNSDDISKSPKTTPHTDATKKDESLKGLSDPAKNPNSSDSKPKSDSSKDSNKDSSSKVSAPKAIKSAKIINSSHMPVSVTATLSSGKTISVTLGPYKITTIDKQASSGSFESADFITKLVIGDKTFDASDSKGTEKRVYTVTSNGNVDVQVPS